MLGGFVNRSVFAIACFAVTLWGWVYFGEADPRPSKAKAAPSRQPIATKSERMSKRLIDARDNDFTNLDDNVVAIVLSLAKAETYCARGVRTSCRQLTTNDQAGRRQVIAIRQKLIGGCKKKVARACYLLGEMELAAERGSKAKQWYAQSKTLYRAETGRCKARRRTKTEACRASADALTILSVREQQVKTLAH